MTILALPTGISQANLKRKTLEVGTAIQGSDSTLIGTNASHVIDWQNLGQQANLSLADTIVDATGLTAAKADEGLDALKLRDGSQAMFYRDTFYGSDNGSVVLAKNVNDLGFIDCTFMDAAFTEFSNLVYLRNCQRVTFKRCRFGGGCSGVALQLAGVNNVLIDGCTFTAPPPRFKGRNEAIYAWYDDNTNQQSLDIHVRNSRFEGYDRAVTVRLATQITITDSFFRSCGIGIGARDLRPGNKVLQSNNQFKDCDINTLGF